MYFFTVISHQNSMMHQVNSFNFHTRVVAEYLETECKELIYTKNKA